MLYKKFLLLKHLFQMLSTAFASKRESVIEHLYYIIYFACFLKPMVIDQAVVIFGTVYWSQKSFHK